MIIIILILFLFIFYTVVICKEQNEKYKTIDISPSCIKSSIYNGDAYYGYRLGDVVYGMYKLKHYEYLKRNVEQKYNKQSIAYIYKNECKKNSDIKCLYNIISSKFKDLFSPPGTCSLHLRVGDVFADTNRYGHYIQPPKFYRLITPILQTLNVKEISILYGSHYKNIFKSMQYIVHIISILKPHFKINIIKTASPDEDFVYMCTSDIFISSGGGFSRLISRVVKFRQKTVINYDKSKEKVIID